MHDVFKSCYTTISQFYTVLEKHGNGDSRSRCPQEKCPCSDVDTYPLHVYTKCVCTKRCIRLNMLCEPISLRVAKATSCDGVSSENRRGLIQSIVTTYYSLFQPNTLLELLTCIYKLYLSCFSTCFSVMDYYRGRIYGYVPLWANGGLPLRTLA